MDLKTLVKLQHGGAIANDEMRTGHCFLEAHGSAVHRMQDAVCFAERFSGRYGGVHYSTSLDDSQTASAACELKSMAGQLSQKRLRRPRSH